MSTCDEVGSEVRALIKELAIRRVEHRSEIHFNESQLLAEGAQVTRLRRQLSFVSQHAHSFRMPHYLFRQGEGLAGTQQLRSRGPVSVHAHYTEGVTRSEGWEEVNGIGSGIGVRGENVNGNEVGVGNVT